MNLECIFFGENPDSQRLTSNNNVSLTFASILVMKTKAHEIIGYFTT